ncbi:MAG: hypothetical protein M3072_13830 [Candidatus Dormibacteraeota bacterium]|nr:hypothetical protein [Candidatus Dormibacteraeota bacterium]
MSSSLCSMTSLRTPGGRWRTWRLRVPANRVLDALDALTERAGEPYRDSIGRAAADPLARAVKLADNADNSREDRLALLEPRAAARLRDKYAEARRLLQ